MVCGECENSKNEVNEVKQNMTYLTHHVYRILLALHVPLCTCDVCSTQHQAQNDLILKSTTNQFHNSNGHTSVVTNGSTSPSTNEMADANMDEPSSPLIGQNLMDEDDNTSSPGLAIDENGVTNGNDSDVGALSENKNGWAKMLADASNAMSRASAVGLYGPFPPRRGRGRPPGTGMNQVGRKSKYCTAAQKAAVADYAAQHGASAAARKYNIPPAVASYYHRKIFKRSLPKGRRPRFDSPLTIGSHDAVLSDEPPSMVQNSSNHSDQQEGQMNGQSKHEQLMNSPDMAVPSSPRLPGSGSKGRGRPKLIGDDLDAKMIEHFLNLRRKTGQKFNADTLLMLATEFVRQKSPGLLMEDGGNVQLRLSWAMKVLARLNEMDKTINNFSQHSNGQNGFEYPTNRHNDQVVEFTEEKQISNIDVHLQNDEFSPNKSEINNI